MMFMDFSRYLLYRSQHIVVRYLYKFIYPEYIVEILVDIPSILQGNLSLYGYQVFNGRWARIY